MIVDASNGGVQLLDDTPIGPLSVDVLPAMATVIVPESWPVHVGRDGTPPPPTAMVYGSAIPETVPVRKPFNSTIPLESRMVTGPVTASLTCVRSHDIRASVPETTRGPDHFAVRLRPPASGVVGLLSAEHAGANPSRSNAATVMWRMMPDLAKFVPLACAAARAVLPSSSKEDR